MNLFLANRQSAPLFSLVSDGVVGRLGIMGYLLFRGASIANAGSSLERRSATLAMQYIGHACVALFPALKYMRLFLPNVCHVRLSSLVYVSSTRHRNVSDLRTNFWLKNATSQLSLVLGRRRIVDHV